MSPLHLLTCSPSHLITLPHIATYRYDPCHMNQFTHLHVHSHYTLLGGTASVFDLANRAAAEGMTALALTDTAVLIGVVQFQQACAKAGIQPIMGMTLPVAAPEGEMNLTPDVAGRLVLLATGPTGYQSLCRLSSAMQSSPAREHLLRQGIPWGWLKENSAGLIALDGGRMGWMERYVRAGNRQAAVRFASRLGGLFGELGGLSLELHNPADEAVARELVAIGERFGLTAVAVHPIYCLEPADTPRLRLLAAIDHNCPLAGVPDAALPAFGETTVALHWQSPDQIAAQYAAFSEAVARTADIARQCATSCLPDGRPIWPKLELPEGQTAEEALGQQAEAGLKNRNPLSVIREPSDNGLRITDYESRLQHELTAIIAKGFAPLFLLVADITRFARETGVPVNTRGSVANSLVAYCLGITQVDPVEHDLLFERFLNPARANLPDIDLDFCSRRRDEVLHYIRETYGAERVALVATVSTMQPKSAARETAKAYGYAEADIKRLTAVLPDHWHPDPRRRNASNVEEIAAQLADGRDREILRAAYALVGQPHHLSVHPGGVVITPGPLTDYVPVQLAPKGFLTTQFDFRDAETIGLPKMDLLGIRALTVLADAADLIRQYHDPTFDLAAIDLHDADTAVTLTTAQTIGVFQCESTGAQRTLRQLQAKSVRDLAVANAFFKPGPALGGMAQSFIRRYRGQEAVSYLHSALEPILRVSQGVLLFQEQILRIATEVAGLTWAEADRLRKGMSKFQAREMEAIRARFVRGCQEVSRLTAVQAETLWGQVEPFAGYGFNQGHATAYADVSYRSAYLKTHYPAAFLCARLADHGGFHHPAIYIAEAQRLGIPVHPPHVNVSGRGFMMSEIGRLGDGEIAPSPNLSVSQSPSLWMGLGQIRDLRHSAIEAIVAARPYHNLRDLLHKVPLQHKEITHLIQCGALDGLADSRAALLAEAAEIERAGNVGQMTFGFGVGTAVPPESLAQRLEWETRLLGWPVSANPIALVKDHDAAEAAAWADDVPLRFVHRLRGQRTTVAGVRLPGWTGGRGFYVGDGDDFIVIKPVRGLTQKVERWQPLRFTGIWREDEWSDGWFEAEQIVPVESST
ncbi:MAG: DNA polymerase III subunit alpha [Anaerolineae bacterium]|nr:DNA polymerase III subunit alpha [Anaerolineae bacterium]